MKNEQVKKTMKGALILSIASLIAKILSCLLYTSPSPRD